MINGYRLVFKSVLSFFEEKKPLKSPLLTHDHSPSLTLGLCPTPTAEASKIYGNRRKKRPRRQRQRRRYFSGLSLYLWLDQTLSLAHSLSVAQSPSILLS